MQSCQSGRQNDVQNLAEEMEDEAAWFVTSLRALGLLWVTIKANNTYIARFWAATDFSLP